MRFAAPLLSALAVGGLVAAFMGLLSFPQRLHRRARTPWVSRVGLGVSRAQFIGVSGGGAAVAFAGVATVTGNWAVAMVPAVAIGLAPRLYFTAKRQKQMREVRAAWPDGIRDIVASLSAGRSLNRALDDLAAAGPAPLRAGLASFPFLSRSLGVVPALEAVREEMSDPTTDRVVEVLIVAHEKGGAIVPQILRDLADATSRDLWASEESESAALELKINARAVFVLPWLVLIAMTARPGPFREFYQTGLGLVVIGVGTAMSVAGAWIVVRLGRTPDEERVLGG